MVDTLVAWDDAATRAAYARYRRGARQMLWSGVGSLALFVAIIGVFGSEPPPGLNQLCIVLCAWGAVAVLGGAIGRIRGWRVRHLLRRHPWRRRPGHYRISQRARNSNGQPGLLLDATATEREVVCSMSTTVWRYRRLAQGDLELHVIGDATRHAVVAGPEVTDVFLVRPCRIPWWRGRLKRIALEGQ